MVAITSIISFLAIASATSAEFTTDDTAAALQITTPELNSIVSCNVTSLSLPPFCKAIGVPLANCTAWPDSVKDFALTALQQEIATDFGLNTLPNQVAKRQSQEEKQRQIQMVIDREKARRANHGRRLAECKGTKDTCHACIVAASALFVGRVAVCSAVAMGEEWFSWGVLTPAVVGELVSCVGTAISVEALAVGACLANPV